MNEQHNIECSNNKKLRICVYYDGELIESLNTGQSISKKDISKEFINMIEMMLPNFGIDIDKLGK